MANTATSGKKNRHLFKQTVDLNVDFLKYRFEKKIWIRNDYAQKTIKAKKLASSMYRDVILI